MVRQMQSQAQRMTLPTTIAAVKRFSEAVTQLKGSYQPQLPLELAFIEAVNGVAVAQAPTVVAAPAAPAATPSKAATPKHDSAPSKGSSPATMPTEADPPPLDHTSIKKLRDQWKALQAQVKVDLGVKVWAALNSVRDIAVSDQGVAFAFGNNAFAQQMMSQTENHSRMVAILSDFLGRPVQLECQLGEQAKLARTVSANSTHSDDAADPLVEYAVNNLGAKIVAEE
jgi:DNA polymerase-3 subunit gamma/tau